MTSFVNRAVLAAAVFAMAPAAANAATLVVNVAGSQGFGALGTATNTVQTFNIGSLSQITGVAYNVNITAFTPSWLSEAAVSFTGSNVSGDGVNLTPGFDDDNSGTMSYADSADLVALGLDFTVGADGILRLEYFETFNDTTVSPDSRWNSGTLTFTYTPAATAVPEPASWAMMISGFGLVGGAMRRRSTLSFATA
jgi:hypothetical protein